MKFHFFIRCSTVWGEQAGIGFRNVALPNGNEHFMTYYDDNFWHLELEIAEISPENQPEYYYFRKNQQGQVLYDGEKHHVLPEVPANAKLVTVLDEWSAESSPVHVFYTRPFTVFQQEAQPKLSSLREPAGFSHLFRVKAPLLGRHQTLCLLGNTPKLHDWDTRKPLLMKPENGWFTIRVKLPATEQRILYKYGIYDTRKKAFVAYEDGENRFLPFARAQREVVLVNDAAARLPMNGWKGAGVAIPVFSLRSREGFGTGEFADIPLFCNWARKTGLKLLQLLPVNDTSALWTDKDSYPYAAISAFALHPLYIRLQNVGALPAGHKLQRRFLPKLRALNRKETVDYSAVMQFKMAYLRALFPLQQEALFQSEDYKDFFAKNSHWLVPYAVFSYLRDRYKTPDFTQWKKLNVYHAEKVKKLSDPQHKAYPEIAFWYFVQYHLHVQLSAAVNAAREMGIALKGDIPIGIYRNSCDAWEAPELYHMDMQAGAPPDDFAIKGQNWGFPTYNWEKMQQDGFSWWKRRFAQMSNYFDAFRIDHILGFFRIWSIPLHATEGIMGHFVPAIPVQAEEIYQRGIPYNVERFTQPYITESLLWQLFGNESENVKTRFLEAGGEGGFVLKPEVNTQRKIEDWFAQNGRQPAIEEGLRELVSNVILFETAEPNRFHFRFGLERTFSFSQLNWHVQQQLKELYTDYFYRRQNLFWQEEAMKKLPALKHTTEMLICGEDLGMVPDCVPGVMHDLGIVGLEVQRMPKRPGMRFTNLAEVPYLSVVTPSTHDMSTVRGWWEEDRDNTNWFYTELLHHFGEAPQYCEAWVCREIVKQHLQSSAMWSIFQLQDLLGMDEGLRRENPAEERINIPADPNHLWNYRMHLKLEDLKNKKAFNQLLQNMIAETGR